MLHTLLIYRNIANSLFTIRILLNSFCLLRIYNLCLYRNWVYRANANRSLDACAVFIYTLITAPSPWLNIKNTQLATQIFNFFSCAESGCGKVKIAQFLGVNVYSISEKSDPDGDQRKGKLVSVFYTTEKGIIWGTSDILINSYTRASQHVLSMATCEPITA